jgi:hypothetical protein
MMCHACNESLIRRLGEGDMNETSGDKIKDNHEVHKETTHATCCFLQACGEVEFIDA